MQIFSPNLIAKQVSIAMLMLSQNAISQETISEVEHISVTASRSEREINEIASSVTVIDAEQVDRQLVNNIQDLVRYEPGVVVEGSGRFGFSGFNIRGINGDRVLTLVDGVPIADEFSFGPFLSARRDFIDVDLIQNVEIIRGPASTLYGSDAIGGVVSFITKEPKNLVKEGRNFGGKLKTGYSSADEQWFITGQLAGASGDWQWLVNATHRDSSERETFFGSGNNLGDARQAANPQDNQTDSVQAKLIYAPNEHHKFTLFVDSFEGDNDTELLSRVNTVVSGVQITDSAAFDTRERQRVQFTYQYLGAQPLFDKVTARYYWQQTENSQLTAEQRLGATSRTDPTLVATGRTRDSFFEQEVNGITLQFDKQWGGESVKHYLIYGADYQQTDSESLREGATFLVESGVVLPEFSVFPARDFPLSEGTETSVYVQDEISLLEGRLTLSPGVRYDDFSLKPKQDAIFSNANPGVLIEDFDDSEVSFKLGAVYKLTNNTNLWVQYAEGFRIPPYDDLNIGFTNFAGGYTSLSNPDLEPETVESWEVGIRQEGQALSWSLSAYYNDYDNFIESSALRGFNPVTGLLEFQSRNREEVSINGIDAQATWFLGESFASLNSWYLRGSLTYLDSEDKATGEELDSILPSQAVVGLGYGEADSPWSFELIATIVERFDRQAQPTDPTATRVFEAPGYGQFDLIGNYKITEDLTVNAGIFNLTDRLIFPSSEVRGRTVDENLALLSRAGRHFSVNLNWVF